MIADGVDMKSEELSEKEKRSEDYCFVCKDGGHLRLCDHKYCTKSYHPECVDKDPTFLDGNEPWTCGWHSCLICRKRSTFKCFCCPISFCRKCVRSAEFGQVKGTKGFCAECLRLAKLVEDCGDVDSDEEKVDFDDRETWEFLFKDYWPIVKQREGLTLENLQYADALLNGVDMCKALSDSDEISEQLSEDYESEDNCDDESIPMMFLSWRRDRKRTSCNKSKSKKEKFDDLGSREMSQFLSFLGKDTKGPVEKSDLFEIVKEYIHSKNLLHTDKRSRKYVISDHPLYCLTRRRKFKLSRLSNLLERLFSSSDGSCDELLSAKIDSFKNSRKRKRVVTSYSLIKPERDHHSELLLEPPKSCYAAITKCNIKAVYLKRSLIVELMGDPTTFETKVLGCFVRVKFDPKDFHGTPWKLYQLGQVTGVKKVPQEYKLKEKSTDLVLCISNVSMDVKICMLSDDDFEEEECKDLNQLAATGLFNRPSIVELEQKISIVHEDIVKHAGLMGSFVGRIYVKSENKGTLRATTTEELVMKSNESID
ncbi:hypothetical protein HPP92_025142 [Vanilla planifolia]|uniref:Plus3 domain-containing protein n=1 Tax=Vanilla planifolia TaxID=51239 RepID=A0A835PJI8_VANPL|nr:hypothetical protein HPP92_025142 [Vanilla planifolia]